LNNSLKISIILATYNRAHLIEETLRSIQNQSYQKWECLIIDDGSTDNTPELLGPIIEGDKRFLYFKRTEKYKKGLSGCRNYGLDIARQRKSGFIQFFDDDDIMHPNKLELQLEPFFKDSTVGITLCKYEGFRDIKELEKPVIKTIMSISTDNYAIDFLYGRIKINSANILLKSELIQKYRFNENFTYGEERELFLRLLFKENPKCVAVNKYLFYYRHHYNSITATDDNIIQKTGIRVEIQKSLFSFLSEHNLLNKKNIAFFFKYFLLNFYSSKMLKSIIEKSKKSQQVSAIYVFRLKITHQFYLLFRKLTFKWLSI